jgi:hypothetical protein
VVGGEDRAVVGVDDDPGARGQVVGLIGRGRGRCEDERRDGYRQRD